MLDIPLSLFTKIKKERNLQKAQGLASFARPYTGYDSDHPQNKVTVMGNPTLGEVKTMIIGVRNLSAEQKSGEIWINEPSSQRIQQLRRMGCQRQPQRTTL